MSRYRWVSRGQSVRALYMQRSYWVSVMAQTALDLNRLGLEPAEYAEDLLKEYGDRLRRWLHPDIDLCMLVQDAILEMEDTK